MYGFSKLKTVLDTSRRHIWSR